MDLHFILQVFRVIELKLGPLLKDLKNALSGRNSIPLHPNLASLVKTKRAGKLLLVSNLVI